MDCELAINDEKALRMWAIEQAQGDLSKAQAIEEYVKGGGSNRPASQIAAAAE